MKQFKVESAECSICGKPAYRWCDACKEWFCADHLLRKEKRGTYQEVLGEIEGVGQILGPVQWTLSVRHQCRKCLRQDIIKTTLIVLVIAMVLGGGCSVLALLQEWENAMGAVLFSLFGIGLLVWGAFTGTGAGWRAIE